MFQPGRHGWHSIQYKAQLPNIFSPSEVNITPERMLTGALLLVVSQPSLSSPYILIRQASPLLYPASYPSGSHQTLYNGMYSPWTSFYYPSVATQRNAAPTALQAPASITRATGQESTETVDGKKFRWLYCPAQVQVRSQSVPDMDLGYILNLVC